MNFLAHLALAGPSDSSRIGNLLGDFEKGTPAALRERLDENVVRGILMHRRIDAFTDAHPLFKEAKKLLRPEHRRFAGVVIDIFFDHLLTLHWQRFHPGIVPDFIADIYETLERKPHLLGSQLGPIAPRIQSENWLAAYQTEDGLALTLNRITRRSPRLEPITATLPQFIVKKARFEKIFLAFYPEIRAFAAEQLSENLSARPSFP